MEEVILVNGLDEITGYMEKMEAHRKGLLHRAFSVLIYNSKGELLLQQRAAGKYHSPLLWTNTCCSHPRKNETVEQAAARRLNEEMGINCALKNTGSFIYKTTVDQGLTEHELDYVLKGVSDDHPLVNEVEVADFAYVHPDEVMRRIALNPEQYTVWFRILSEKGFLKMV